MRKLGLVLYCLLQLWLSGARAQAPVTNFSATPTSGCGPLSVQFTDNSTNNPVFWSWDFGNGQTSSLQNPAVQYATAGTYTVTLITRNSSGSDAVRKTDYITVYPYPVASFNSNTTLACTPASIQFIDNSTPGQGSITSYAWNFGDGSTSNLAAPSHSYAQPGYYGVSLTVQNSGGCTNTAANPRYLRLVDGIQPNFVFNQSSASCVAPFTGTLLNQTAGPGTLTYNWTLANGATPSNSTATNPTVTFPSDGTYNVTLQVSSTYGCSAQITDPLTLSDNTAVINGPTTVCVNAPVTFSNGSTPTPPAFTWTFGDGSSSNAPSPSKTFTTTGPSSVTLVNKYAGCTTTATEPITVINPPTPAFTATNTASCKAPLTVNFTDQTTPTPTTWLWNFGDGGTSTLANPSHTYTATGNFNVTLTVTSTGSCPGSTTKNALVTIQAPTVIIGGTLAACTKGTGSLSVISPIAIANAPDGVSQYAWSAPGSIEGSSTAATPTFTYNTANTYTINLTITTTGGCTATASRGVQIGTPVSPAFTTSSPSICGNLPVTFTPTNQNAAYTYYWDFGDGHDSTVAAPPNPPVYPIGHTYQKFGTFPVTLTLTNSGCPSTAPPQNIIVSPPIANFGYHVNCPGNPLSVNFIDSSLIDGAVVSYTWNFGDPSDPTPVTITPGPAPLPTHVYPAPGTYPVMLTVVDGACSNTVTKNIVVAGVTPSFIVDTYTPCENAAFNLTSTSTTTPTTGLIATYAWTVGPNSAGGNPFQTAINTPGTYGATLVVTDINGCIYTAPTQKITVTGPIAAFTGPVIGGGCTNQPTTFVDASTAYPGSAVPPPAPASPLAAWTFTFGDGQSQTFTASPFTHQYTDSGKFNVQLIVGDAKGCNSTAIGTVQIDSPIANFSVPDSFYCPGVPLTFTDLSQGYSLTDTWAFNDGTGGTTNPHPFPALPANATYTATLTVADRYNCINSITRSVNIKMPIAAFNDYDTTAICTPLETTFAAHNQFSDSLYWDFGDGTTSTLDSTFHFYNSFNTFTVTLYAQGPGGCLASTSKKIYVEDPVALTTLNYSPLKHCDSVNAQFNIAPAPYTSFFLSFGDNVIDSSGNPTPIHVYHLPGIYQPVIQLTDKTGCIVQVGSPLGNITVLGATPFFSVDKHAFCDSSIVNFTDFTISNDGLTSETYNFGDGSPLDAITGGTGTFNASHDYITPGTWTPKLTVTTTDNCTESYSDTIRVYQTPHPMIATSSLLCTGLIQFNGSLTAPQVDTITWAWNFGNNQQSSLQNPAVNMTPGTYTVTLQTSTSFGCQADTNTSVTIFGPPTIKGPPEVTAPVGMPVTLPITYSADVVSYAWTPATNLDCPTCPDPVATLIFSTEYYVTATDENSCTATDSIFVKTICNSQNYFLPNTFSPNGDGVNDYFYPRGTSIYDVRSLTVFNRWGQMVFQRRDFPANAANMGWDGTFGGKPAPADAYVYVVEVVCDNSQVVAIHGSVTLVR